MKMILKTLRCFSVVFAILFLPFGAQAQIEEVVVTAQKRQESLLDVPVAVNALTGDVLDALNVRDTDDIVNLYPGLSLQTAHAANSGFTIRGVGTANFHITGQQAVGQYMDGVSMVSPWTSTVGIFDMERVEVLRGPQNTLFGRNTTGGAVNFISRKPEAGGQFNGYARVTGGNKERLDFEGAVGMPLGDTAAIRVAVTTENRGNIFRNLNGSDRGDIERYGFRAALAWEPTDLTSVLFNVHANYNRGSRTPLRTVGIWDDDGIYPVNAIPAGGGAVVEEPLATALANGDSILGPVHTCSIRNDGSDAFTSLSSCVALEPRAGATVTNPSTADWHTVRDSGNPKADFDYEGLFLQINHDLDNFTLESITSYDEITGDFQAVLSALPSGAGFYPGQGGIFEVWSQEVRLTSNTEGPFNWIIGGYYSEEDDILATIINRTDPGAPPFGVVPSITIDQDVTIWSLYGQGEYKLSDATTVTVGLRYTDDSKEGISRASVAAMTDTGTPAGTPFPINTYFPLDVYEMLIASAPEGSCAPPPLPCQTSFPVEQSLTEFGGKVGIDHYFNKDFMAYASYSRGFKSGAFDTRALAAFAGTADRPVAPEFLDAFEIGSKSSHLDGKVELSTAMFYYIWEDRQTFDTDDLGQPAFLNIPEAEILGLELEVKWAPSETWYVQGGFAYMDSEITDVGTLSSPKQGSPLSNTPEISFTGLVSKDFIIADNRFNLQANFKYNDEHNTGLADSPVNEIESTLFLNARGSYYFGSDEQYELSIWADNITEEKVCRSKGTLDVLSYQFDCLPNPGMVFYGATIRAEF